MSVDDRKSETKGSADKNPYKVSSQKEMFKDTCFIDMKTKGNKAEKRYT